MKRIINYFFFIACCLLCWTACHDEKNIPDVSDEVVNIDFVRFDSMVYHVKEPVDIEVINSRYPAFSQLYFNRILGFRDRDSLFSNVRDMISSQTFQVLGEKAHNQYDDIEDIKKEWRQAMQFYSHYFQPSSVPDFYTTVTEFAFGSFIFPISETKDAVGVSVEMFLGDTINYTAMAKMDASFSDYNARTFNREHLIKKAVDALVDDILLEENSATFLPYLLRAGKKQYVLKQLLPYAADTVLWEYTPEQLAWVRDNEVNIYQHLVSEELFFSKERSNYLRLLSPGPSSPGMPPEAPGRAATYIGYKIIESYMDRHPDTTLPELMRLEANALFQAAKYKPRIE